ncbi:hypothetical protein OG978_32510 [Streptomyces sp. NBC_01591]|uniref:hypothetical protein n=1 Tax=Streptomyces sp. NBC_01591 TaxID=2975888 RepID=UPI002DD80327|nr:hypothetical protein [Streptomyces sp. NBC_01591]WSD71697.1 hypothetical protein OG978_32510 [Streptomyces sp. NBC_01591]
MDHNEYLMTDQTDPNAQENVDAFLAELATLTTKYRLSILGCGCCGSPALQPLDREDGVGLRYELLTYNRDAQRYTTDRGAA